MVTQKDGGYAACDRTDALEAYDSFRAARSLFFWLLLIGLVAVEVCFWAVDRGLTEETALPANFSLFVRAENAAPPGTPLVLTAVREESTGDEIDGQNGPMKPDENEKKRPRSSRDDSWDLSRLGELTNHLVKSNLRVWYYVLTFGAMMYCLTLLIGMKIALVGRLGGLADATRSFFLSLVLAVMVIPWQQLIGQQMLATLFGYEELLGRFWRLAERRDLPEYVTYYWRFVGLWGVTFLILLEAQRRSWRAARKVRQRLAPPDYSPASGLIDLDVADKYK